MSGKHYVFDENRSKQEAYSKVEIDDRIEESTEPITEELQSMGSSIETLDNKFLKKIEMEDGDTEYILDLDSTTSQGRKLLVNSTSNSITIKLRFSSRKPAGTPAKVFCCRNGTVETKTGTVGNASYGPEPFTYRLVFIDWFTLTAGSRALVEVYDFWTE